MIQMTLNINGVNLTNFIKYPISYTRKNLDESLDLLNLTLFATNIETPFKPNTIAAITISDGNELWYDGSMLLTGDTIERVGVTNKFHHKMVFIELTYLLSLEVLPDMAITRVSVVNADQIGQVYEPTLADVVDKILKYSEGTFSKGLGLSGATRNILAAIQAPELTFTRYTTLEALRLVFGIAKIVPYIQFTNLINHIGVSNIQTNNLTEYAAKSEAYNAEQFRTKLYSPVENFIGGGDLAGSIVEPSADFSAFRTTRSLGTTDIKEDSAAIKLTRPIYKVEGLYLKPYILYGGRADFGNAWFFQGIYIPISNINEDFFEGYGYEITDFLVEKSVYDLKQNTEAGKGTSFFYEQNKNIIEGISFRGETWLNAWKPAKQAYLNVLTKLNYEPQGIKVKESAMAAFLTYVRQQYFLAYGANVPVSSTVTEFYGFAAEGYFPYDRTVTDKFEFTRAKTTGSSLYPIPLTDSITIQINVSGQPTVITKPETVISLMKAHELRFKVRYTPYINTKIFTYKERKEADDPTHQTMMFYNQSANTISDETLAELHDKVIKRGNAPTQTIKQLHKQLNEIPFLGRLAGQYVITAEDITLNADNASVEYVLSKDYAKLNQYVAVLEKYRQFAIPSERVVDRQFTINEFAKFSRTTELRTSSLNPISYLGTNEADLMTLNTSAQYKLPDDTTVYNTPNLALPTTNFAFNNALVFETSFLTNATASEESVEYILPNGNVDFARRLERPIPYTDNVGYFQTFTTLSLGTKISSTITVNDGHKFPIFTNETLQTTHLTRFTVDVDKDARERLSVAYILHHIDETGKVYLNAGWTLRNGLIGGPGYTGLRFAYFNSRPIEGRPNAGLYSVIGSSPNINISAGSERVVITHTAASVPTSNYWGVIDENNELLFWVNEPCVAGTAPAPLYINFRSTY
jgi:hypothetical protein